MKKLWMVAMLIVTLTAPLYGAGAFGIGFPLFGVETEMYQRPAAGGAFLEAYAGGFTAVASDPNGKNVIPFGMSVGINVPHAKAWLVRVDAGRVVREIIATTDDGRLIWSAEAIRSWFDQTKLNPSSQMPLVIVCEVVDARRNVRHHALLGFLPRPFGWDTVKWENEKRPTTLAVQFDNWCGWRAGQPWREPPTRFWQDRITWNRATEVSDLVPTGQEAGTENWTSKWASQLGPGNSVLAKVSFEDGQGRGVDPRGQIGLFFLVKRDRTIPSSLPGSLCELVRLPREWHALPDRLRSLIKDLDLQPWVLVWKGDPRAATFVVSLAIRQAVAASFPDDPGLRRLLIVGADGFEGQNGLPLSFGTDDAGQDVRVLVPTGQGGANLPRLWLDLRGFPENELQERGTTEEEVGAETPPTPSPATKPATPAKPDEPERLE